MSKHYTLTVELDENGDECLTFPEEVTKELGWKPGDEIIWRQEGDSWILAKKDAEQSAIEYEKEDLDRAKELYARGYVTNEPTEANIIECAKAYYQVRIKSWDYNHKDTK